MCVCVCLFPGLVFVGLNEDVTGCVAVIKDLPRVYFLPVAFVKTQVHYSQMPGCVNFCV